MTSSLIYRPGKLVLTISLLLPLLTSCTTSHAVDQTYSTSAAQGSFSEAQLDSLLAPIALYPDTVLSHVLIASTYPLEVVEADRWARNNTRLEGDDAVNAVEDKDWDPSVKALVAFPDILQRMSEDLDWTQQLGDAFLADEERVMDSIQKLRNKAYASGSLDKVENVRVIREKETIVIEPSVERVVYVPAYDTRVVYGSWWWPDYPPVYWHYPSSYVFVSGFYWGPRVYIGPRFYFSGVHWHQRRVVVVDHHHHHGHRFYDSRSVVRHSDAKHWHHNPVHRRGVAYYDNHTRERFHSPRESYSDARHYRAGLVNPQGNRGGYKGERNRIAPNTARDQRQGRDEQFQQRLQRGQAGQIQVGSDRDKLIRPQQPRAEQLRERLNSRENRDTGGNGKNYIRPDQVKNRLENNAGRDGTNIKRTETQQVQRQESGDRQPPQRTERPQSIDRIRSAEQVLPQQQDRQLRPQQQNIERRDVTPRVERSERMIDRSQQRPRIERSDRPSGGGMERRSGGDVRGGGDIRGGRER